ncbi:MAG: hypothetical protein JO112_21390, partial [Planctomycetes bacterium]|nr:hypothetical protein [Planctomycetota bacterium]
MVPRTILRQLARLRRRERLLRLTWGGARWLALAAAVLTVACLTDWLVDRRQETPWTLRYSLLGVQAALWSLTGILWIFRPLLGRLSDGTLALWVEDRVHRLGHRLISAVQLNRSGAPTQGMSPELIAAVTREAEEQTANIHFTQVADHRRWKWSLALFLPVALVAAGLWLAFPATVEALVARQFLADRPIPRSVLVESVNSEMVVPSGDVADLRFHVTGDAISRDWQGEVRITRAGRPEERVPLEYESRDWPWEATFVAHVPPTDDADFTYQASVRDGRTRDSSRVHYEPRPAVVEQRAWVVLPRYVGLRPDGTPYEQEQPRGDILGLREASARVAVTIQKPVSRAVLEFLSPSEAQPGTKPEPEKVLRRMDLALREDGRRAEGTFALADLGAGEAAYRVVVEDQYGFRNLDPARRGIRIAAEETPHVALLPEQFPGRDDRGTGEDSEVEGLPVPLGGSIRLGYTCSAPYGLGRARLRYRVNDGSWWHLPLAEVQAGDKTGPFDSARGVFANSGPMDQVEFHTIPSPDPTRFVGGTEGGGRFDFQTRKIPGLKVGDKIELCVEVFDRNPDPTRPPGRSEERVKSIVTVPELETWVRNTLQEESRIRRLEARQRGVFGQAGDEDSVATAQGETTPDNTGAPRPVREGPATSFVRDWQLLGVFPSFGGQGHQTVYPPETEPVNLAGEYPLIKNSIRWQPYQSLGDYIDLAKYFKHRTAGVAYAVCWVHSEGDRPIQVRTGSDDGLKVWLRRNLVTDVQTNRAAAPGQETAGAHLQPGWNELLVKVDNGDSEWGFYLEILDPATGKMPEDLDFRTTLPEKDIAVQGQPSPAFLRDWQLVGPFPNPDDRGLETAYPPELENVDLTREFDGLPGKVRWRLHHSDDGKIDLEKFFAHDDAGVAYALCWVRSPWKRPALLATGSDDGLKVWVNRKVVLTERVHREAVPGDDKTPIELEAGWNELLVKVDNRVGTWAFYLELRDPGTSAALPDIEVRTTPPGGEAPRMVQKNRKFLRNWQVIGPFPNPDGHG